MNPLLVSLHWALALLIIGQLSYGFRELRATPNSDPHKITVLRLHMEIGMAIVALMFNRLILRIRTSNPAESVPISHYGPYILVFLMAGTGLVTAILSCINMIVFGPSGGELPPALAICSIRVVHGYLAMLLPNHPALLGAGICRYNDRAGCACRHLKRQAVRIRVRTPVPPAVVSSYR